MRIQSLSIDLFTMKGTVTFLDGSVQACKKSEIEEYLEEIKQYEAQRIY